MCGYVKIINKRQIIDVLEVKFKIHNIILCEITLKGNYGFLINGDPCE